MLTQTMTGEREQQPYSLAQTLLHPEIKAVLSLLLTFRMNKML